ncbi:MAG: hypothetical protein ACO2PL_11250 [Armatimonadota bacterium]
MTGERVRKLSQWEGEPPSEPNLSADAIVKSENFSAVQEHCPPKPLAILPLTIRHLLPFYQSPFAVRQSLLFLARQKPRPPFPNTLMTGCHRL